MVVAMEGITGVGASSSAVGTGGVPGVSLRTSRPTSLVFAVGDAGAAAAPTLPIGWVPLSRHVDRPSHSTSWGQYANQPVGAAGTTVRVTTGSPAGGPWSLAAVELTGNGA